MNSRYNLLNDSPKEIEVPLGNFVRATEWGLTEEDIKKELKEALAIGDVREISTNTFTPLTGVMTGVMRYQGIRSYAGITGTGTNPFGMGGLTGLGSGITGVLASYSQGITELQRNSNEVQYTETDNQESSENGESVYINREDLEARKLTAKQMEALMGDRLLVLDPPVSRYQKLR